MSSTLSFMARTLALSCFLCVLCLGAGATAQGPKRPQGFSLPFPVPGLPNPGGQGAGDVSPEKFFEHLLQPPPGATEEEEAALEKVEFTWEEESKLGQAQLEVLRRELKQQKIKVLENGKDAAYLARLVALLRPKMKQAERYKIIRIYIVQSRETEAYTLAGGHLLVSKSMLDFVPSEAALVCVLGHELSHLDRGHLVRQAKRIKLAEKSLDPTTKGFALQDFMSTSSAMMQLSRRPFGPQEELDADADGMRWACEAGYDPRELAELFDRWAVRDVNQPANFMPAFFRSHPLHADRSATARKVCEGLLREAPLDSLYVGRENSKRRLTRDEKRLE